MRRAKLRGGMVHQIERIIGGVARTVCGRLVWAKRLNDGDGPECKNCQRALDARCYP